jgi:hypothetical protein
MKAFRALLTDLGGRTFLTVNGFSIVALVSATLFLFTVDSFTPEHWLDALETCALLVGGWIAKRGVEEIAAGIKGKA